MANLPARLAKPCKECKCHTDKKLGTLSSNARPPAFDAVAGQVTSPEAGKLVTTAPGLRAGP